MSSKNVKTLHITWIQWATLIAAVATLVLIVAPRFRHQASMQDRTEDNAARPTQKEGNKPARGPRKEMHGQHPEMVAP